MLLLFYNNSIGFVINSLIECVLFYFLVLCLNYKLISSVLARTQKIYYLLNIHMSLKNDVMKAVQIKHFFFFELYVITVFAKIRMLSEILTCVIILFLFIKSLLFLIISNKKICLLIQEIKFVLKLIAKCV